MSGFLDTYGAGDERRARNIKLLVWTGIGLIFLSLILYFFLHNYPQERQARRFFDLLAAHNYDAAYAMWVSTDAERHDYPMQSFMRDWGPQNNIQNVSILDAESCGNVVIVDADLGAAGDKKLWINRSTLQLGFGPYEQCLQQNRIYNLYRAIKYRLHGRTYQ